MIRSAHPAHLLALLGALAGCHAGFLGEHQPAVRDRPPPCGPVESLPCADAGAGYSSLALRLCGRAADGVTLYQFSWARAFHPTVVVEVSRRDQTYTLSAKRYDARGSDVDRTAPILPEEWDRLEALLDSTSFWSLRPADYDAVVREAFERGETLWGYDGAQWHVEGVREGHYQSMDCWSPDVPTPSGGGGSPLGRWGVYVLGLADLLPLHRSEIY